MHDPINRVRSFRWRPGNTPLSTPRAVVVACCTYLLAILLLRLAIRQRLKVPRIATALHNLTLCVASLAMFTGSAWESYKETQRRGSAAWLVCLPEGTQVQGPLYFWSYMYYASKFYELLDTVLLVLKAKPLTFLHVFHHTVVVPMAFLWLAEAQSLQHIALMTNTFIHVIMYFYYFLCSLEIYPSWKRLITNSQIAQFIFSFAISVPFWWQHFSGRRCSGFNAMVFNAIFNLILLALFVNFHRRNYAARKRKSM